ncbi:TPA: type 1 fimbrial protein [Escherichia coli]|nr:type 1 fimbrial protein [Escherichia coli]
MILGSLIFITARALAADTLSQSVDITMSVNIAPPVCNLTDSTQTVDFGEIQVFSITMEKVKKDATFSFTGCTNVNNVTISFSGNNVDKEKNFIKNKTGTDNATGIAIKLYDDKQKEIQLKDSQTTVINKDSTFNYHVTAAVVKENGISSPVTAGKIETSVDLNITYN